MLKRFLNRVTRVLKGVSGYTLVEVAAVIAVTGTLAAVAIPVAKGKIDEGKIVRANQEVKNIGGGIVAFIKDTGRYPFYVAGTTAGIPYASDTDNAAYQLLDTDDGDAAAVEAGEEAWNVVSGEVGSGEVGSLDAQLVKNTPGYKTDGEFAWKGPYVPKLTLDPWGTRYYVNVIHFSQNDTNAVWVLSAGPDKEIDTPFTQILITNPGVEDDDIAFRVK